MPEGTVYVGRPTVWANPFKISKNMTAKESVERYRGYIQTSIRIGGITLNELEGKDLACWCGDWEPGQPEIDCHAVVLLTLANKLNSN